VQEGGLPDDGAIGVCSAAKSVAAAVERAAPGRLSWRADCHRSTLARPVRSDVRIPEAAVCRQNDEAAGDASALPHPGVW